MRTAHNLITQASLHLITTDTGSTSQECIKVCTRQRITRVCTLHTRLQRAGGEPRVPHILLRGTLASRWCPASLTGVKRNGGGMCTYYMWLQERLDVLTFMAYMALICGLLMLISARYGKP